MLIITPNTGTKMLIITGKPIIDGVKSEIMDLESEETRCRDFANFPKEMKGSTGVRLGRIPVICGGLFWEHRPLPTGMFRSFEFWKNRSNSGVKVDMVICNTIVKS